ncbi:hypothetical protein PUND_b0608 [Pseudoalteromonas undina]|nr:hypothetical protein PUND_b0608 [Pseudoalteromonas undina]
MAYLYHIYRAICSDSQYLIIKWLVLLGLMIQNKKLYK